jgi:probable HAF family extracellular repeat protein
MMQTAAGETHAFLWDGGTVTDLSTLGGSMSGTATNGIIQINNRSQIVGVSTTAEEIRHAFLWDKGTMIDLNDVIPPDCGWIIVEADRINNHGQIVGSGTINGETHAYLLTPRE